MAPGQAVVKSDGGKKRLVIDYRGMAWGPDIAQYGQAFQDVVEKLREADADEVVLSEYYERIYDEKQTGWLREVADLVNNLEADAVWSPSHLGKTTESKTLGPRHDAVLRIMAQIKSDPFKAYLTLVQEMKTVAAQAAAAGPNAEDVQIYLGTLRYMRQKMEEMKLIQAMKDYLSQLGSIPEGRTAYHAFFESSIKPSFIGSRIFFSATEQLELVDQYDVGGSKVYIYRHPDQVQYLYFINPPEYSLPPEKYFLLEKTKEVVAQHRPESVQFLDITQARKYFRKVYVATIADLALKNNIKLSVEEKEDLASIVARYTIGYGIMEVLLSDRRVTDVYIDSPLGDKPIYLVHGKYGQCQTNVIFSNEEARSIVSRFRALSGRPFDEAHPILDFDLEDLQTRIAVIGKPLALDGIAFALRLHKQTPWTLAQFVDGKAFGSFAAGMLSFFVDAQASMLIVGSRGAGKCLEGDTLIQMADGSLKRIEQLVEENLHNPTLIEDGCYAECNGLDILTMTSDLKVRAAPVEKVWRRSAPAEMFKIMLASGKQITTTPEHPFFTVKEGFVTQIRADELKTGGFVATPRTIPTHSGQTKGLDLDRMREQSHLFGLKYPELAPLARERLTRIQQKTPLNIAAAAMGMNYRTAANLKNGVRNAVSFEEMEKIAQYTGSEIGQYVSQLNDVKSNNSNHVMNAGILTDRMTMEYARLLGLLYGDGHVDDVELTFTNTHPTLLADFQKLSEQVFGAKGKIRHPKNRSPMYQVSSRAVSRMVRGRFGLPSGKKAPFQEMPNEILSASDAGLAEFIKGYFDCDSSVRKDKTEIEFCTASPKMAEQMQYALLRFGIQSIRKPKQVNGTEYYRGFIRGDNCLRFAQRIGFGHPDKQKRLEDMLKGRKFNSNVDVIPNAWALLEHTKKEYGFGKTSLDQHEIGRNKLQQIAHDALEKKPDDEKIRQMHNLAHSELYWDRVVQIEKVAPSGPYVYDLTVDGTHSFVANGIIAHNTSLLQAMMLELPQNLRVLVQEDTQELPVPQMKKLGLSIQRMKTRPPLGGGTESEVSAEDALRTALRLGDSVLIVGEVRSGEAKALYEAMRVGAVGNVVMGTIHGESAYSIWDRVVNDLGVPTTSFKATDFCVVAAPIRFKGSLKRHRRLIEVTEVLKDWESDPGKEHGFVNWMTFDANKDDLEIFKDDIIGKSEWLKKVQRMRGLDADEVWNEILARGQTKQYLVDQKNQYGIPRLLEAEYAVRAHMHYLILTEKQREETGNLDYPKLMADWKAWVDSELVADLVRQKQATVAAE
ncbi:Flp pilus assembly complex ATPase component TadA [Candidatus Micrarchaeota archaeon]|nr:Flp pilus assembly complex ATPase component TadA [Candidatus Micrarchaeota archaeon]